MSEPAPAEDTALGLLARPGFARLLAYRIFAMLSYQVVAVTVGWHIYEVTRNPFSLGLVGLAEVLPFFCVAPFAGYLVDHLPRRRLGMVACAGLVATAVVLAGVALGWLPFDGVWPIYAAIALTGMVRAFLSPIYNALFARVLARGQYARGAGLGEASEPTHAAASVLGVSPTSARNSRRRRSCEGPTPGSTAGSPP